MWTLLRVLRVYPADEMLGLMVMRHIRKYATVYHGGIWGEFVVVDPLDTRLLSVERQQEAVAVIDLYLTSLRTTTHRTEELRNLCSQVRRWILRGAIFAVGLMPESDSD